MHNLLDRISDYVADSAPAGLNDQIDIYSEQKATHINQALEMLKAPFYSTCNVKGRTHKTVRYRSGKREGKVRIGKGQPLFSYHRVGIACGNTPQPISRVSKSVVGNWLKREYGGSLYSLIRDGKDYAKKLLVKKAEKDKADKAKYLAKKKRQTKDRLAKVQNKLPNKTDTIKRANNTSLLSKELRPAFAKWLRKVWVSKKKAFAQARAAGETKRTFFNWLVSEFKTSNASKPTGTKQIVPAKARKSAPTIKHNIKVDDKRVAKIKKDMPTKVEAIKQIQTTTLLAQDLRTAFSKWLKKVWVSKKAAYINDRINGKTRKAYFSWLVEEWKATNSSKSSKAAPKKRTTTTKKRGKAATAPKAKKTAPTPKPKKETKPKATKRGKAATAPTPKPKKETKPKATKRDKVTTQPKAKTVRAKKAATQSTSVKTADGNYDAETIAILQDLEKGGFESYSDLLKTNPEKAVLISRLRDSIVKGKLTIDELKHGAAKTKSKPTEAKTTQAKPKAQVKTAKDFTTDEPRKPVSAPSGGIEAILAKLEKMDNALS